MQDGFERRALLLQMGEALKAAGGSLEKGAGSRVARAAEAILTETPSLTVTKAYASWPALLLAEKLDKGALAKSVSLAFTGNPGEWKAYLKSVQKDVPGFGEGVTVEPAKSEAAAPAEPEADKDGKKKGKKGRKAKESRSGGRDASSEMAVTSAGTAAPESPLESASQDAESTSEGSVEAGKPSWPWKPVENGTAT
jgi:hypothetical protein